MRDNRNASGGVSVLKIAAYAAAVFLLAVFQASVAPRFPFFGATPAYLLAFLSAAAFFDGEKTGAVVGLAAGYCSDALGGVGISVMPVAYTLLGWTVGKLAAKLKRDRRLSLGESFLWWTLCLLVACGIGALISLVCCFLSAREIRLLPTVLKMMIPEAAGTFLLGYPIGIIFMLLYRNKNKER